MDFNNNKVNIDLENILEYLSFKALSDRYIFNLGNEDSIIGKGSFGEVFLLKKRGDNTEYAGKYLSVV